MKTKMFPDETEPEPRPTAGHHEDAEAVQTSESMASETRLQDAALALLATASACRRAAGGVGDGRA
jgi:hypothetical protein